MLIRIIRYLKGYVKVRLSGYSPERFLNLCSKQRIFIWDLQNVGLEYEMYMSLKSFRKMRPIIKKTKSRLVLLERHGFPFFMHRYRKRKMFFFGILLCSMLLYVMSLFIWNIEIDGNYSLTSDVILHDLEEEQVAHGIRKTKVDCEEIERLLRNKYSNIIWTSAEIKGTRLFIHVKENMDGDIVQEEKQEEPVDLVAAKDGMITSMIIRSGVPQSSVGAEVKKGDLLVLGRVDIVNDAGEVVDRHYVPSDGDIYARTTYNYEDSFLLSHEEKQYTGRKKTSYFAGLFDRELTVWNRKPDYQSYSVLKQENPVKITENFYLPASYGTILYEEYETITRNYTEEEARALAEAHLQEYFEKLEQKGVQIAEKNVTIEVRKNYCISKGTFTAVEEISETAPTEMIRSAEEEERTASE